MVEAGKKIERKKTYPLHVQCVEKIVCRRGGVKVRPSKKGPQYMGRHHGNNERVNRLCVGDIAWRK